MFIANRYIIHNNGATSYSNNYHREYDGVILHFGENIWAEIKNIPTKKLDSRHEPQKLKGIWLGRDTSTNEHLVALPRDVYRDHPSVTATIYRCRGVTRMPSEQRFDAGFTSNIDWPTMEVMDDIEKASLQTFIQLRDSGTSLRASAVPRLPSAKDLHQPLDSAYPSDYIANLKASFTSSLTAFDINTTRFGSSLLQNNFNIGDWHPVQVSTC